MENRFLTFDNSFGTCLNRLNMVLQAYRRWVSTHGEEPHLPGLDLTHDQLFFLNYAQVSNLQALLFQLKSRNKPHKQCMQIITEY